MHQKHPPAKVATAVLAGLAFAAGAADCACTSAVPDMPITARRMSLDKVLNTGGSS